MLCNASYDNYMRHSFQLQNKWRFIQGFWISRSPRSPRRAASCWRSECAGVAAPRPRQHTHHFERLACESRADLAVDANRKYQKSLAICRNPLSHMMPPFIFVYHSWCCVELRLFDLEIHMQRKFLNRLGM